MAQLSGGLNLGAEPGPTGTENCVSPAHSFELEDPPCPSRGVPRVPAVGPGRHKHRGRTDGRTTCTDRTEGRGEGGGWQKRGNSAPFNIHHPQG